MRLHIRLFGALLAVQLLAPQVRAQSGNVEGSGGSGVGGSGIGVGAAGGGGIGGGVSGLVGDGSGPNPVDNGIAPLRDDPLDLRRGEQAWDRMNRNENRGLEGQEIDRFRDPLRSEGAAARLRGRRTPRVGDEPVSDISEFDGNELKAGTGGRRTEKKQMTNRGDRPLTGNTIRTIQQLGLRLAGTRKGLRVNGVRGSGLAARAGLRDGDVIRTINTVPLRSLLELERFLTTRVPEDILSMEVLQDGEINIVALQLPRHIGEPGFRAARSRGQARRQVSEGVER